MKTIYLIHWKTEECPERLAKIRQSGFKCSHWMPSPSALREVRLDPPKAFVIDLSRLPSQGRDLALNFRQNSVTCMIPILFIGGASEKIEAIRKLLPDALYTDWDNIGEALSKAIANPLKNPIRPKTVFDGYAGTPLVKKLGIKEGSAVALICPPAGFRSKLGILPDNVIFQTNLEGDPDLIIWFVKTLDVLNRDLKKTADSLCAKCGLWICWPKKGSRLKGDLTQPSVRHAGLAIGLVDYKVCAIDETWTGLKFAKRKVR